MKYILDSSGYVESASCNPISCDDKVSQEYTGSIPSGYSSLDDWILNANIRAYKITNGNLVYDSARDAALQAEWEKTQHFNSYSTTETLIGTWIDGKPLYRKVINISSLPNNASKNYATGLTYGTHSIKNFYGCYTNGQYEIGINEYSGSSYIRTVIAFTSNIQITTNSDRSSYSGSVVIEYTKTTD